jgi:hypothetical protein
MNDDSVRVIMVLSRSAQAPSARADDELAAVAGGMEAP